MTLITTPTGLHVKNGQIVRQAWGSCYYKESSFQTLEDMYIAAKDELSLLSRMTCSLIRIMRRFRRLLGIC